MIEKKRAIKTKATKYKWIAYASWLIGINKSNRFESKDTMSVPTEIIAMKITKPKNTFNPGEPSLLEPRLDKSPKGLVPDFIIIFVIEIIFFIGSFLGRSPLRICLHVDL